MENQWKQQTIGIAGCGGLGGNLIENFLRLGMTHLVVCDGDVFEPSNMDRQILCTKETMGKKKVDAARERAKMIAPDTTVEAYDVFVDENNGKELFRDCVLIVSGLRSDSRCAGFPRGPKDPAVGLQGAPDSLGPRCDLRLGSGGGSPVSRRSLSNGSRSNAKRRTSPFFRAGGLRGTAGRGSGEDPPGRGELPEKQDPLCGSEDVRLLRSGLTERRGAVKGNCEFTIGKQFIILK